MGFSMKSTKQRFWGYPNDGVMILVLIRQRLLKQLVMVPQKRKGCFWFERENPSRMEDDWGYPVMTKWKPPYMFISS